MLSYIISLIIFFVLMVVVPITGVVTYAAYKILNKSANIGDSTCSFDEYAACPIRYDLSIDNSCRSGIKQSMFSDHGADPYADRKHNVHEALKRDNIEMPERRRDRKW